MTDVTLYGFTLAQVTLADAIQPIGDGCDTGLLYTPARCYFARREAGGLRNVEGRGAALDRVFEARVFGPADELRWLRDPQQAGRGTVTYLSQTDAGPAGWSRLTPIPHLAVRPNRYLLWGQVLPVRTDGSVPRDGWVVLATSRIGELPVPFGGPLQEGQGLRLIAREYLGQAQVRDGEEGHGNRVVRAECLYGIEAYGRSKRTAEGGSAGIKGEHTS